MPTAPRTFRPPWVAKAHKTDRQLADKRRGSARARGYDNTWQRLRDVTIDASPVCSLCGCLVAKRKSEASTMLPLGVVDHIKPFGTDESLRLDPANLRVLCKPCHDRTTAANDGGYGNPRRDER